MRRLLFMIIALSSIFQALRGQDNKDKKPLLDSVIYLGGKVVMADVVKVNADLVSYKLPGKVNITDVERKQVEKIIYKNGRKEILNNPIFKMLDETQWESVLLTEDPNEIQGLYNRGIVKAKSAPSDRSKAAAKENATIRLRKKAAFLGAGVVLITRSEAIGAYGDIPAYVMEGIAYGTKPPEEKDKANKDNKGHGPNTNKNNN